jgi:hypothetical protein
MGSMLKCFRFGQGSYIAPAVGVILLLWLLPGKAPAAAPEIGTLSLRGLQTGATTTLTIEGTNLLPRPRLLLPVPIAAQTVLKDSTPNRITVEVTLSENISPGIYPLRLGNRHGISEAVLIGVDDLIQIPFTQQVAILPAALDGRLSRSGTLKTSFSGKRGQRITVEIEARRLGAALDPVLELYDSRQVLLAYSQGHAFLGGDARLEAVLPADGRYTVAVHDLLYQAGSPNYFRLKIGELYYANWVFPLGGRRGTEGWFELIGMLPPAARWARVDLRTPAKEIPVFLPPIHGLTGVVPRVFTEQLPEIMQSKPPKGALQNVAIPAAINGRIQKPGEEDRYRLRVKPGMHLRLEVLANRAGSPLDGVLYVRNETGAQLAMSDDRPNTIDPGLDFTVPDGMTSLVVALADLEGRGGKEYLYRLVVAPADRPDFRLTVSEDRLLIPRDGTAVMRVGTTRTVYQGPIKLSLPGLPKGITVSGDEIPAGATETLLSLSAPHEAKLAQLLTRLRGTSSDGKNLIQSLALTPQTPVTELQPWLRSELALAVTEPEPVQITWENADPAMVISGTYSAKVKVTRARGSSGPVRFSLLTSQTVPQTSDGNQENSTRTLRIEKRSLLAADQAEATVAIGVPEDLPVGPYDLAVRAELLSADGKRILATAVTPSRRLQGRLPFALQLIGPAVIETKNGAGLAGKLKGRVIRAKGYTGIVSVTLAGLPEGHSPAKVTVAGDQSDFELPINFPSDTKLGTLLRLKVVATSEMGPQRVVKSIELPVSVQLSQGGSSPD